MIETTTELFDRLFSEMRESKRREESIEAYKAAPEPSRDPDEPKAPAFNPEPELTTLTPESRTQSALRAMLYDLR